MKHLLALAFALSGCGLVVGLRTDYQLSDASVEGGSEGGSTDAPDDAVVDSPGSDGLVPCPMPTDVNCGGPNCPKCSTGSKCNMNSDCASNNCLMGHCKM